MFISEAEKAEIILEIAEKMKQANQARGDLRADEGLMQREAEIVLTKILQVSSSREQMNDRITHAVRRLEGMVPEEQVAWLRSNTSMLHKRLDGSLLEDKQMKEITFNLLSERNDAILLKKTDDIVRLQGFLKDCRKREVAALHEALAILESVRNLLANPLALTQALGVLVYEKLRVLPIDKNARDTIAAALPRDTSLEELAKVELVVKLTAVALSTLSTATPPNFFAGDHSLELDREVVHRRLHSDLSQPPVATGNVLI